MSRSGRALLEQLRRAGVPEAEIAEGILQLCHQLQGIERGMQQLRGPHVVADDLGEAGGFLDEIAGLTDDDDDKPFFWDWGGECH